MYRDSNIPSNFHYVAEISDNYIVYVQSSPISSSQSYEAYYQYFNPSTYVLHVDNYRPKHGNLTVYSMTHSHDANGNIYLDDITMSYTLNCSEILANDTFVVSDSDYERADYPIIFLCQFTVCVIFVWVFSQLSRIFFKGGLR